MSKVQHWEVNQTFIDTCNENVELIRSSHKNKKPVKLKSFIDFENYEDEWWDKFYNNLNFNAFKPLWLNKNMIKFNYDQINMDIPILNNLSEHLFNKVFNNHTIVLWISLGEDDAGTDWHQDFQSMNDIPTYLICMNLIGKTQWEFKGYENIEMTTGDIIAQNGSVPHKIIPRGMRITLAGHSSLHNIKL